MIDEKKLKKFLETMILWKGANGTGIRTMLIKELNKVFKKK